MAPPRQRGRQPLRDILAANDLSSRSVRALAVVALATALGLPFFVGWRGWLRYPGSSAAQPSGADDEAIRPRLVWLPGGSFWMGSEDGPRDERPRHQVTVSPFAICATEVSARQYEIVTGERPNDPEWGDDDDHPVHNVSWEDAARYLNALTELENRARSAAGLAPLTTCYDEGFEWDQSCTGYRLPTEAEWEYAARAGSETKWSFGSDEREICAHANIDTEICDDGFARLAPIEADRLEPNAWELHGMHGNVWEWIFDWYDEEYYATSELSDPVNEARSSFRVLRGGSFFIGPEDARSANRLRDGPTYRGRLNGFRCARGPRPQH